LLHVKKMAPSSSLNKKVEEGTRDSSFYNAIKDITSGTFGGVAQVLSGHRKFIVLSSMVMIMLFWDRPELVVHLFFL
jgi:hypothetical protein